MKYILILSDSLTLSRYSFTSGWQKFTWVIGLSKELKLEHMAFGHALLEDCFAQLKYHDLQNKNYVIIQAGINDLLSRPYSYWERTFLNSSRIGRWILERLSKATAIRLVRRQHYTSVKRLLEIIKQSKVNDKLIYILPSFDTENSHLRFKGVGDRISLLERGLTRNGLNFISPNLLPCDFLEDGVHLTEAGHHKLLNQVRQKISELG